MLRGSTNSSATKSDARQAKPTASTVERKVTIEWRAPNTGGSPITSYLVTIDGVTTSLTGSKLGVTRTLKPEKHTVTVAAANANGTGRASAGLTIKVKR